MQTSTQHLLKTALLFGSLSGLIVIGSMITGFVLSDSKGFASSQAFGFLIMLIALSLIFVGIKRHRDIELAGTISFGRALLLGSLIAAIAGVAYVAVWEIYLAKTNYAYIHEYVAGVIELKKAEGVSGAELQAEIDKLDDLKASYANPLMRIPITFTEIFPVGFVVALISAALLRKTEFLASKAQN